MAKAVRWVLIFFHLGLGSALALIILLNFDPQGFRAWGAFSLAVLATPALMLAIAAGLWRRRVWVKWLALPLLILIVFFTLLLSVGAVFWPESFFYGILTVGTFFAVLEILTFICAAKGEQADMPR